MEILKVCTVCSGYDSQCMALDRLGIKYDLVAWSEIDKYAITAHNAVYPQYEKRNLGDLTKIDWEDVPNFDLFTYSTPCTDISKAGKNQGMAEGSGTRSSIIWSCREAIASKRPKYILMENVQNITSAKNKPYLDKWIETLKELGYDNYYKVLDASDYGVPQRRKRFYMVSIRRDLGFGVYIFPYPFALKIQGRDLIDKYADDALFLPKEVNDQKMKIFRGEYQIPCLVGYSRDEKGNVINHHMVDISNTITTFSGGSWTQAQFVLTKDKRLRRMSMKELFRYMDVDDANISKIMDAVKSTTVYEILRKPMI